MFVSDSVTCSFTLNTVGVISVEHRRSMLRVQPNDLLKRQERSGK